MTTKAAKVQRRVTVIDVVWRTRKAEVEEEMKRMLEVEELDPASQEYFGKRTAAAKQVYNQLDAAQQKEVAEEVERRKVEGNDTETWQRYVHLKTKGLTVIIPIRLAPRASLERVKQWSEKCWQDMGVLTMTFYGYLQEDGKWAVDMYVTEILQSFAALI